MEAIAAGGEDTAGPAVESKGPAVELLFDGIATAGVPRRPDPPDDPVAPPLPPPTFRVGAFRLFALLPANEVAPLFPLLLGPAPLLVLVLFDPDPEEVEVDACEFEAGAVPAAGAAPTFGPGMFKHGCSQESVDK